MTSTIIKSLPKYIDWICGLPPLSSKTSWKDTSVKSARILKKIESHLSAYADFDFPELQSAHHTLLLTACLAAALDGSGKITEREPLSDADLRRIIFAIVAGFKTPPENIRVDDWLILAMSETPYAQVSVNAVWIVLKDPMSVNKDREVLYDELFPLLEKALPSLFRGKTYSDLGKRFFDNGPPHVQLPEERATHPTREPPYEIYG